jgi:hypothetical protein
MFRSRKSYPKRHSRSILNYRDLERGVYDRDEIRQSLWALGGPTALNRTRITSKHQHSSTYSDDEDQDNDLPTANVVVVDDDDDDDNDDREIMSMEKNEKSNDETEQMHRRLWCICKKPWDHSRLMLRCDSCSNWYHGDW